MQLARITLLALLGCLPPLCAAAATDEHLSVVVAGTTIGHLKVQAEGNGLSIDFDFKNNGRGPTIAEQLELDRDGLPRSWKIQGSTTFGSKVDERFQRDPRGARWTDANGNGSVDAGGAQLYIGQNASPWALGLYARALLSRPEPRLEVLPAGQIHLQAGAELSVGSGDRKQQLRHYTLNGLDLDPSHLLLDADQQLFAVISPRLVVIRKGYEEDADRLRELAVQLGQQRLERIQSQTAQRYPQPVRVHNVRVFDPHSLTVSAPRSVVFQGRRISGVQPADAEPSPDEVLIDGEGGILVAGLYEMHAHTSQDGAILNIAAGVTSMRDMGNDNAVLASLIDSIESGQLAGPRITRSGFIEGRSPYSSNNGILVGTQQQALDAVRWYAARGFAQVKLYNSMKPAWTAAAVTEAHRLGLRAAGHVPAFANADAMIEAGYDELTHINQIMLGWVLAADEDTRTLLRLTGLKRLQTLDLDSAPVRHTLDLISEHKVAVEPTIAIHERLLLNRGGRMPKGMADFFAHMPVGYQRNAMQAWTDMSAPGDADAYAAAFEKLLETLRRMRQREILLIPGTDLGGWFSYHRELQLFERIGYTPAQVLRLATLDMAAYLGQDQSLGSVEKGKLADFFLIPADPTQDLRALGSIRMVVKDGVIYFPAQIHPHFGIKPFATPPQVQLPAAKSP